MSGLDGGHKETPIISEFFWLGFGFKQIIVYLPFFLLTHIGQNFNLKSKCLNNTANPESFDLLCFFSKLH